MASLPELPEMPLEQIASFSSDISWAIKDMPRFLELMKEARSLVGPGFFFGDNLFTWCRNLSLAEDKVFVESWKKNLHNNSDQAIVWRRYILACAAYHCVQLDGDFVECGVYAGTGIKTVMDYIGGKDFPKIFWGYDTFDYNPVEGHQFAGQQQGFYEQVQSRFAGYSQVKLIKGLIPDSFAQGEPEKIAYLHIDLNNAEGEIAALERLFDKVVPGGMIILDDYEWAGVYRNQKKTGRSLVSDTSLSSFPFTNRSRFRH